MDKYNLDAKKNTETSHPDAEPLTVEFTSQEDIEGIRVLPDANIIIIKGLKVEFGCCDTMRKWVTTQNYVVGGKVCIDPRSTPVIRISLAREGEGMTLGDALLREMRYLAVHDGRRKTETNMFYWEIGGEDLYLWWCARHCEHMPDRESWLQGLRQNAWWKNIVGPDVFEAILREFADLYYPEERKCEPVEEWIDIDDSLMADIEAYGQ